MPTTRSSIISNLKDFFFLLVFATTYYFKICCCTIEETLIITCPEIEKQALVSFKQSLKDPDDLLASWKDEVDCCLWEGVVCNNLTGHVHQLRLRGRYNGYDTQRHGLRGKINSSLLNLKYLRHLDLSLNDFGETIPSFIGSFASMEYLNLSQAGFVGAIPHTIGNLSNLRALNLQSDFRNNDMLRYSDNLDWLSGLSKLEHLNMNMVYLKGVSNWVHAISTLPRLSELRLQDCGLEWSTSIDFVNISSLVTLDLSYNELVGAVVFLRRLFQVASLRFLYLSWGFIGGPIPSTSNTTNLEYIDLSNSDFNSTIPDWLYACNNLEVLNLHSNSLIGTISNDISNLSSLTVLDLSSNNFSGNVPPTVWKLCKIHTLDLSFNQLQGDLSDFSGNMSECFLGALESLDLDNNQFSGHIGKRFGNFKNLQTLILSRNSISGSIPSVLGELSSLETLHLHYNKFDGNLPESLGRLFNLKYFDASYNLLEGVVTERHLIDLKKLSIFFAFGNQLSFNVSPNWIPPFQLDELLLASTNLSGPFPSWLETQTNIYYLDLSNSSIHGVVPNWVWNTTSLNLAHNNLHGNIPNISRLAGDYSKPSRGIYLSSNRFSGPLPHIASDVNFLDISNNSISGSIANVICANNATESYALEILLLDGNHLSGKLPDCWMRLRNLRVLSLRDNNLYGSIPSSIGLLTQLETLNLCNNRISGNIPPSILNSTKLVKIDLSGNYLDGNLPEWTKADAPNLAIIILRSNRLSGRIKSDICLFTSLQILDLSNNNLYGAIPRCFDNFTRMVHSDNTSFVNRYLFGPLVGGGFDPYFTDSATVTTKGQQRTYDATLGLVADIDLSNNNLSGNIPLEVTRLASLRLLNLSRNHLSGSIPSDIGDMKQLESLDLSLNSLTGEIPSSFTVMSSLNYLNLSYNDLTGRIPESTQLQTMNASSFVGNNLCGPPLTVRKCGVNDDDGDDDDDDDDDNTNDIVSHIVDVDWFIVLLSLGFTIGLSTFLVVIIFGKSLREAYFEMLDDILEKIISILKFC